MGIIVVIIIIINHYTIIPLKQPVSWKVRRVFFVAQVMNLSIFHHLFPTNQSLLGGHSSLQLLRQENHMALADETRTWRISFGTVPWKISRLNRTSLGAAKADFPWILEGLFVPKNTSNKPW